MTAPATEVDTVADRILHILVNKAGPEETLDREVRWSLQAAQLALCDKVNPTSFRDEFSITTTTGTATYDLPDDFKHVIEDTVRFSASDFRTLTEIPVQTFHRFEMTWNQSTGDPVYYHILNKSKATGNWQIFFSPTPDTSTREIVGSYRCLPDSVWNSTRGSGQLMDRRFTENHLALLVHGAISEGHFSRYLNGQDLASHEKKWLEGLATSRDNNDPVVGKVYQRFPTPGSSYGSGRRGVRIPGGIWPAWWGGQVS